MRSFFSFLLLTLITTLPFGATSHAAPQVAAQEWPAVKEWLEPVVRAPVDRPAAPVIEGLIAHAHELIGTPYLWGGISRTQGFDCSGLIVYLFRDLADIHLPRTVDEMKRMAVPSVARRDLQPGDLLFFNRNGSGLSSHMGLYIGEGRFIHAPRTGKNVRIDSLHNRYWSRSYLKAKRPHAEGERRLAQYEPQWPSQG